MICKFAPTILSAVTNCRAKVFNEDGGQQKHVTGPLHLNGGQQKHVTHPT